MVSESLTLRAIRAEQYSSLKSTSERPGCDGTYVSIAGMEDTKKKFQQKKKDAEHRPSLASNTMSRDERGQ